MRHRYKLTTRDMGPVTRCLGELVPPPQPFQHYLPDPPRRLANFTLVRLDIKHAMRKLAALEPDMVDGMPYYGALFATLAWRCAATFRATDYQVRWLIRQIAATTDLGMHDPTNSRPHCGAPNVYVLPP